MIRGMVEGQGQLLYATPPSPQVAPLAGHSTPTNQPGSLTSQSPLGNYETPGLLSSSPSRSSRFSPLLTPIATPQGPPGSAPLKNSDSATGEIPYDGSSSNPDLNLGQNPGPASRGDSSQLDPPRHKAHGENDVIKPSATPGYHNETIEEDVDTEEL
jgi:hypothetical protein